MFVVLGASGHIGDALVTELLKRGQEVLALTHDPSKIAGFHNRGVEAMVVDVHDVDGLRAAFRRGNRAYLLNPPAPISADTDREERASAKAILQALEGTSLEKVVLQSTYGAQPGDRIGDLSVLFEFEQGLRSQSTPVSVLRAAYYMTNFDPLLPQAKEGQLPTMFPADFCLPMVAPTDIAASAVDLLAAPPEPFEIHYIEGPDRYTLTDMAKAFESALHRNIEVESIPSDQWQRSYRALEFSPEAVESFARMMKTTIEKGPEAPLAPHKGQTSVDRYIRSLVGRDISKNS